MKLARVRDDSGDTFWAQVNEATQTVRRIGAPFEVWAAALAQHGEAALDLRAGRLPLAKLQLCTPVNPGARVFGVGLNYLTHLTRLGRTQAPAHTIAYIKPSSALVDPGGEIQYPAVTAQLDYEVELVAVVARALGDEGQASANLLGYTVGNDISARDAGKQLGSLDLFTQKALDRTAPIGPWITTLDEFGGAGQPRVAVSLRVNGEQRQRDTTDQMIFPLDELLNYVDARIQLQPGDLVFTGSTCGVGLEDGRFLQPGDTVEAEIERIGILRNTIGPKRVLSTTRRAGRLGIPV